MKRLSSSSFATLLLVTIAATSNAQQAAPSGGKQITVADMRAWKSIRGATVSADGRWFGYELAPTEGDAEVVIRATNGTTEWKFPVGEVTGPGGRGAAGGDAAGGGGGGGVDLSADSKWAMFSVAPLKRDADRLRAQRRPVETKVALVNLANGQKKEFDRVRRYAFAGDHPTWVALYMYQPEVAAAGAAAAAPAAGAGGRGGRGGGGGRGGAAAAAPAPRVDAADLLLYNLTSGDLMNIGDVGEFSFEPTGSYLVYTVETANRTGNGVQMLDLRTNTVRVLDGERALYRRLTWADSGQALAVLRATPDSVGRDTTVSLVTFTAFGVGSPKKTVLSLAGRNDAPSGLEVSLDRAPRWSEDRTVVYIGLRTTPKQSLASEGRGGQALVQPGAPGMGGTINQPNTGAASADELPSLILWHWKDPRLQSQQIVEEARDKRYTYLAEYRLPENKLIRLTDDSVREVTIAPRDKFAYALDESPYQRDASVTGRNYVDFYAIDLRTGARSKPVTKLITRVTPSSDGTKLLYWNKDEHWYVLDLATGESRNITKGLPVSFANTQDDHNNLYRPPQPVIGWSSDAQWVLLSDGWDVWKVSVSGAPAVNLTGDGRTNQIRYQRRAWVEPKEKGIDLSKPLYFVKYGEWTKKSGLARVDGVKGGATSLSWDDASFSYTRARDANVVLYTRQSFRDFPDWYVAKADFTPGTRLTDANPQQKDFAWSGGVRLVDYVSAKGDKLQGTLWLPANYVPGKKYPMLVEIYEKESQGAHTYSVPSDTRAPDPSVYTNRGYAVFEPDIVYRVNDPGMSAVWCVVPAVKAAIKTGIVDSAHVGLHGHSWGGYQTAFLVTQTNIFAAAIAGAPLTDMVSMYSSVYWNTGGSDAAIFESSQGRFKGNFIDNYDAYIRNSPAFHSKNVHTPLIILSDDKDGAVDFNQGITWFNTLRGLGKNVMLFTYVGENHGLAKPVNQRDYAMRMGQFFDHYLKDAPAPDWMTNGIPRLQMEDHLKAIRGASSSAAIINPTP